MPRERAVGSSFSRSLSQGILRQQRSSLLAPSTHNRCARALYLCFSGIGLSEPHVIDDSVWIVRPDPPSNDQDLTIDYTGDDETVSYEIDGEDPVRADVRESGRITIPKAALRGKRFVTLRASGGERGYRIVRLPSFGS